MPPLGIAAVKIRQPQICVAIWKGLTEESSENYQPTSDVCERFNDLRLLQPLIFGASLIVADPFDGRNPLFWCQHRCMNG